MIEILKFSIPALLVIVVAYVVLDKLLKADSNRRNYETKLKQQAVVTPVRLRAYERLMLVLERTTPTTLIVSAFDPGLTAMNFQAKLLDTIREEYGHNASQQIYVSNELWTAIRASQESLTKLVNICALQIEPETTATGLAEIILEVYSQSENIPVEIAIDLLKREVKSLF